MLCIGIDVKKIRAVHPAYTKEAYECDFLAAHELETPDCWNGEQGDHQIGDHIQEAVGEASSAIRYSLFRVRISGTEHTRYH